MTVVVDASAILAVLNDESGQDVVIERLDEAAISVVNLAEVIAALIAKGKTEGQARMAMRALGCAVVEADEELGIDTGILRKLTQPAGLSLGDRFCLALARRLGVAVLTADQSWSRVADACGVQVRQIR
ncbi:MAG: type II toxin-antitoxin system VapC family toxin [Novosphingobium sp.]|nr:type II toxin-antitoxin system VapC family toxin [Novosphingobium sp.]